MSATAPLPPEHPAMLAWAAYAQSPDFENAMKWLGFAQHREGQLWAAFYAGFQAGEQRRPILLDASSLSPSNRTLLMEQVAAGKGMMAVSAATLPPPVSLGLVKLMLMSLILVAGFLFWWFVLSR